MDDKVLGKQGLRTLLSAINNKLKNKVNISQLQTAVSDEVTIKLTEAKESGEFDGTTPNIGENGNWYIGNIDTGVRASGEVDATTVEASVNNYFTNNPLPTKLSDLTDDETHRVVTDEEKSVWNAKSDFSGNYEDLTNKPDSLPASDVYDWAKAETKPTYTASEVGALPANTVIPTVDANSITSALGYTPVNPSDIVSSTENWEQIGGKTYPFENGVIDTGKDVDIGSYKKICAFVLVYPGHGKTSLGIKVSVTTNRSNDPVFSHFHTIANLGSSDGGVAKIEAELKGFLTIKSVTSKSSDIMTALAVTSNDIWETIAPNGIQTPVQRIKIEITDSDLNPISTPANSGVYLYGVKA